MNDHPLPMPHEPAIRLEVAEVGYDEDMDEDPASDTRRFTGVRIPKPASPGPAGSSPLKFTQRVPPRVQAEILRQEYEPSIAAGLSTRYQPGTPEFNAVYARERTIQISQTTRPDPAYCARGVSESQLASEALAPVAEPKNPWVVKTMSDAVGIFGLALWIWLGLQFAAVGALAHTAAGWLKLDQIVMGSALLAFTMIVDWGFWRAFRNRFHTAFRRPALILLLVFCVIGGAAVLTDMFLDGRLGWNVNSSPSPPS